MLNRRLVYNTLLLTGTSLLMQAIGMAFQAWLAGRVGAGGIGLYQLTLSVTNLAATFAISGVRFAATRLVAEELGAENADGVGAVMGRCLGYGAFFGTAALLILRFLALPLGAGWIGDGRTVRSLELSACSMPCIALCSALSGYFTACGRVWKPALIHLIEQLVTIALTAKFLAAVPGGDLEKSCAAVTAGRLGGDVASLLLMLLAYRLDREAHLGQGSGGERVTGRMLRIALPLALSAYARSALSTLQHLLVPRGLRAAGYSADRALAGYGVIQGMALPVVLFPSCLLAALSELIVPTLTEAQVRHDAAGIRRAVRMLLSRCLAYSLLTAAFLFLCAAPLGWYIYQNSQAGRFIRILAPLIPILYTDMAVDGCLKGLGEQVWSMGVNIFDALLGLLLVWQLLPRYALAGFLIMVYATEIVNFLLSALRLVKVIRLTGLRSSQETAAQRSQARPAQTA